MIKKDILKKRKGRVMRRARIRARIIGTEKQPRLSVFRSLKHVYAQLVDDVSGKTVVGLISKKINVQEVPAEYKGKIQASFATGYMLAVEAKKLGITKVVFDRGGYKYHGRVKAVAEGARKGGLEF